MRIKYYPLNPMSLFKGALILERLHGDLIKVLIIDTGRGGVGMDLVDECYPFIKKYFNITFVKYPINEEIEDVSGAEI